MAKFIALELFAGVGGMSLGFHNAGFRLAAAIEKDPIHASVHAQNFPRCAAIVSDVSRLSGGGIRASAGIAPSADIHVLIGGPPCQGFSFGGKRDPRDPRNVGVLEFGRMVGELRPLYFVMENVDGLMAPDVAEIVSMFLGIVAMAGYDVVTPIRALEAVEYGVPQWRNRVFIIGYRRGCPPPKYPSPLSRRVTVKDALGDIPSLGTFSQLLHRDNIRLALKSPSRYARSLRDRSQRPGDYLLTSCSLSDHSQIVRSRFGRTAPGAQEPVSRFFRLDLSAQATTLRAGTDISRGRFTAPRPIHPIEDRCITVREAARLHSFPDHFKFHPTIWHGFRQIGNAVPPALANVVAMEIRRALSR